MSDLRFEDVVIETASMIGPDGRSYKACCGSCGTYFRVSESEFKRPWGVGAEKMGYVAKMRAWNCCHEDEEALDGFPERPDEFWLKS